MNDRGVVSVRLRPDEADTIRAAAEREHSTVSEYLRGVASRAALLARPGAREVRLASGAQLVFWTNSPQVVTL